MTLESGRIARFSCGDDVWRERLVVGHILADGYVVVSPDQDLEFGAHPDAPVQLQPLDEGLHRVSERDRRFHNTASVVPLLMVCEPGPSMSDRSFMLPFQRNVAEKASAHFATRVVDSFNQDP